MNTNEFIQKPVRQLFFHYLIRLSAERWSHPSMYLQIQSLSESGLEPQHLPP